MTPSIVPGAGQTTYIVVDDDVYRETRIDNDFETVVSDLIAGQYDHPIRVIALNTAPDHGWLEDVSVEVAREIKHRCDLADEDVPDGIASFVTRYLAGDRQRQI
jgi:hypothetical protein